MKAEEYAPSFRERFEGLLIGTAVGDSVGLPAEGLSRRRVAKLFPGPWRQRLVFGRGMLSDDSEHAFMVGQALLKYPDDPNRFERSLAWKLRWWLAALPAGVGLATLRACIKLWMGFSPKHSGVHSAGNGPAMRSVLIGAFFADDREKIRQFVMRSTRLTHTDHRATIGAMAVAMVAAHSAQTNQSPGVDEFLAGLREVGDGDTEWMTLIDQFEQSVRNQDSVGDFAEAIGCGARGVSGYIYRTVPVAIYAWFRHHGDFRATLESVLQLGGDTDTVGAIAGALAGPFFGARGIPDEWQRGMLEWPRGLKQYSDLAGRLAVARNGMKGNPVKYFWPAIPVRNLFFLIMILFHGFRRLFPPY